MYRKIILTAASLLCISVAPFAKDDGKSTKKGNNKTQKEVSQDSVNTRSWYKSEYAPGNDKPRNLGFDIHGITTRPVRKESLNASKLVSDFIPGYPVNWITHYNAVEIWGTCNGIVRKAIAPNATLSNDQVSILKTGDMGSEVIVNVYYTYMNPVNDAVENNEINVKMTIVPEVEAEYMGGINEMKDYFNKTVMDKIYEILPVPFTGTRATFIINETGEIKEAAISKPSGNEKVDKLVHDAIRSMPKWKPAEGLNGKKVKQSFEFSVGNNGGC